MKTTIKPIAITPGDPSGIGPDILLKLSALNLPAPIVAIANKTMLMERALQLNSPIQCVNFDETFPLVHNPNRLPVIDVETNLHCDAGTPNPDFAKYIINTLTLATEGCLTHRFSALVTGPVNKALINEGGIAFSGHTEFLAKLTRTKKSVMLLMTDKMKVALLTTHLPLKKVPSAITSENLKETIAIISNDIITRFGIKHPCIVICGLNPHAGEGGHLGEEEQKIMIPVINELKQQGFHLKGPISADTAFTPKIINEADVILAMYHDQGLPVLKYQGFGHAVNVTLGLPIIRTSVDHGTAYDIAGTGKADAESLHQAVLLATKLATTSKGHKK